MKKPESKYDKIYIILEPEIKEFNKIGLTIIVHERSGKLIDYLENNMSSARELSEFDFLNKSVRIYLSHKFQNVVNKLYIYEE